MSFPDIVGSLRLVRPVVTEERNPLGGLHSTVYRKALRPRAAISLGWDVLERDQERQIREAIETLEGPAHSTTWIDWLELPWYYVPVGVGDGATVDFELPVTNGTGHTLYVQGVEDAAVTISTGTGSDGADEVTFTTAPAGGRRISVSFTGKRLWSVFLAGDTLEMARMVEGIGLYTVRADFLSRRAF